MSDLKEVLTNPIRLFYVAIGCLFTAIGVIGLVVPLMPGTIFLIIAAACFTRSSKRLEHWLLTHPHLGHHITAWRAHGAISKTTKRVIYISLLVSFFILNLTGSAPIYVLVVVGLVFCGIAAFIQTRPHPPTITQQSPISQDFSADRHPSP